MYKYWGAPLFSLTHFFAQIIISFVHLVCWISWLLYFYLENCKRFSISFLCNLWILNIVWSPSNYLSLHRCVWFHSRSEKCIDYGGALTILTFWDFLPILEMDANGGEVLEGLREFGFMLLVLFISILPFMLMHPCLFLYNAWLFNSLYKPS